MRRTHGPRPKRLRECEGDQVVDCASIETELSEDLARVLARAGRCTSNVVREFQ